MPRTGAAAFLFSVLGFRTSVRSPAIQINQDVPRFRALAWADDATVLQFVHDARRAGVAQPQPPLQQRDARLLFAADDLHALLDQLLVFVAGAFLVKAGR